MKKYYLSQNAGIKLELSGLSVEFDICQNVAGSLWGVFSTDNTTVQGILSTIVGKRGVSEVSEDVYNEYLSKKNYSPDSQVISPAKRKLEYLRTNENAEYAEDNKATVVADHEVSDLENTAPRSRPTLSVATSYQSLADALNLNIEQTKELMKREGAPKRSTKGWKIKDVLDFKDKTQ